MNRFIHEVSLMAALLVLVASLWQDWGTLVTLKRMLVSYLCFFGMGAGMTLVVRAARVSPGSPTRSGSGSGTAKTDAG